MWFDAHGDMNTPASSPSGHYHGMVLRTLLGQGPADVVSLVRRPLDPARVVLAGVRDLDAAERACIERAGIALIEGLPETAGRSLVEKLTAAGVDSVYIHVDVDVFDPDSFSDALFAVPGGPTLECVAAAVAEVADAFEVVGVGVVEYCGKDERSASRVCGFLRGSGVWPPAG